MQRLIFLWFVFNFSGLCAQIQDPSAAVFNITQDASIKQNIKDRFQEAAQNALKECGGYHVRLNLEWRDAGKSTTEIQHLERNIREVVVQAYIKSNEQYLAQNDRTVEELRESAISDFAVMTDVRINTLIPNSGPYELHIFFINLKDLGMVMPSGPISFSENEVYDQKGMQERVIDFFRKHGICKPSPDQNIDIDAELDALRSRMMLFVIYEHYTPGDQDIIENRHRYLQDENLGKLYWEMKSHFYLNKKIQIKTQALKEGSINQQQKKEYLSFCKKLHEALSELENKQLSIKEYHTIKSRRIALEAEMAKLQ